MVAPRALASSSQSLPPMLYTAQPNSIPGCSKAPRGLSVLLRVTSIFAGATVSPSPSLRQRTDRYAFRAGRVLSDEEFRYHRTLMVRAVVHQGFGSRLWLHECSRTHPLNRMAPDRRQPLYIGSRLCRDLCFW
jgi:hypothetical protein